MDAYLDYRSQKELAGRANGCITGLQVIKGASWTGGWMHNWMHLKKGELAKNVDLCFL